MLWWWWWLLPVPVPALIAEPPQLPKEYNNTKKSRMLLRMMRMSTRMMRTMLRVLGY